MKVFKVNEYEFVCAKSEAAAKDFYHKEYGDEFDEEAVDEIVDLKQETMWHGYNVEDDIDKIVEIANKEYRRVLKGRFYEIKIDKSGNFEFVVKMSFAEVIKYNGIKKPYILATKLR